MKNYEKPVVLANEDVAEGVYAASGGNCWTPTILSSQDWNGSHHVFEVHNSHSASVEHISLAYTVVISFSAPITDAYAENNWPCSCNGSDVTVTRTSHANAYQSGDETSFKVFVKAADEGTTKALTANGITCINCEKTVNVQGGGADGN